jgi:hypothetical protein
MSRWYKAPKLKQTNTLNHDHFSRLSQFPVSQLCIAEVEWSFEALKWG